MADGERAAKAARAKALLKKRQQQKKSEGITPSSGTHSPSASVSRVSTPAPVMQDSASVSNDVTAVARTSPIRDNTPIVATPSPAAIPGRVKSMSPRREDQNNDSQREDYSSILQDQRQTIALLVSEKSALAEALERLEDVDSQLQGSRAELENKLRELERLQVQLAQIETDKTASLKQTKQLEAQNSALTTKLREEERELHSTRSETESLRSQLLESERRIRELEEQIQNDDRVDILETTLRNTQDRAEEVGIQLSKLKQAYEKLKSEHEESQEESRRRSVAEVELRHQTADLEDKLRSSEDNLSKSLSERNTLAAANASAVAELNANQVTITELSSKLSQASADLSGAARQLESCQSELRHALRRAEDAEAAQRDLQEEGTGLMRSLDEMRPKIIELTGAKLELMEKLEQLTASLTQRDSTISDLETQLESAYASVDEASREYDKLERERAKEKSIAEVGQIELQKAYNELQAKYDDALAATREVEADKGKQRQVAGRLQDEVNRLLSISQARQDEIDSLRSQADGRDQADDDERRLLDELQQEVESLRSDVAMKEEELFRLRHAGLPTSPLPSQSLDDEVKGAITQQLELEVSNAKSTIRTLESSLYDAEAKYLSLQKHVAVVENELSHLRSVVKTQRSAHASRDPGSARHSTDIRRSSFASQRSNNSDRLPPSALIDEGLPPVTRRQRHMSLAMLQARMYSEAEAANVHAAASKTAIASDTEHRHSNTASVDSSIVSLRWPQFLDESHVFWCATCKGDLIVL